MQIINPSAGGLYSGLSNAISTIYRIEGIRTLWRGVTSVIVGAGGIQFECRSQDEWLIHDTGPAHAVYFGTYEAVKEFAGGNKDDLHHPFAAGIWDLPYTVLARGYVADLASALSGACATISSDALMNPFDGIFLLNAVDQSPLTPLPSHQATDASPWIKLPLNIAMR